MTKEKQPIVSAELYSFCTVRQLSVMEAINAAGNVNAAAKALGVHHSTVQQALREVKNKASIQGVSPEHHMTRAVPDTHIATGISTYFDMDGNVKGQWVKSNLRRGAEDEALRVFAATLGENFKSLAPITKEPKRTDDDLLCVIPMGDPHFGMYAWAQDAGADFCLEIAEKLTYAAIDRLVDTAPVASTALLVNLGDMFHADNQKNQTNSGHQLDVDGRWPKVQQVGLMAMVHAIMRLLEKYPKVIFRINKGNHDGHSSYGLALMLSCWFRNEPRVTIDLSPAVMWYYRFGKVLLASTHGDTIKGKDMLSIMAADRPEDWGLSRHRYCLVGHVHHHDSKEYHGGIVEYFNTMAARDAWHQGQGYRAGRDMRLIVYHRQHGEVERHRVDIGMLES